MMNQTTEKKRLLLIELNEINVDVVEKYMACNMPLPTFEKLLSRHHYVRTISEAAYDKIEPWIQWPSVHTGLDADEHMIFRLGDITESSVTQIFEVIEQTGRKVGCISAMNASNNLKSPAYFIPDPWTKTSADDSWWSQGISRALSQAVNDNAQSKVTLKSAFYLALSLMRYSNPKHYPMYFKLIRGIKKGPWRKAIFLDLFLHDLHMNLFKKKRPDFSTVFFNAGAHIQHHYFFNSKPLHEDIKLDNPQWYISEQYDPVYEIYSFYDKMLAEYLALGNVEIILSTALSQLPYDRVKYYYRLRNHDQFLKILGIDFLSVLPRMTRDFLITFKSENDAIKASTKLSGLLVNGTDKKLFGQVDHRGDSLFVTLTYPDEIDDSLSITVDNRLMLLLPHVVFVAIKNGMHQGDGFSFFSPGVAPYAPKQGAHIKDLYSTIMNYFEVVV